MTNKHYERQTLLFNSEFSKISNYQLFAWSKSYVERIKKYLLKDHHKSKTLIDIGAGDGCITVEAAKLGLKVISMDLSKAVINNIKRYKRRFSLPNINIINGNAEKLPIRSNTVDYVVANAILEHIQDEARAIKEWKRILRPGGRIMVTVPLKFRYVWPFLWPVNYIHDKQIGHLRRYDLKELKRKFNMKVVMHLYTGHLVKACWVIFAVLFKKHTFDAQIETIDEKGKYIRYGASNIIVIFEK